MAQNGSFWAISGTPYFRTPNGQYGLEVGFGPPGGQKGPKRGPKRAKKGHFGPFGRKWPKRAILGLFGHFGHFGPSGAKYSQNRPFLDPFLALLAILAKMAKMAILGHFGLPEGRYRAKMAQNGPKWPILAHFGTPF